jgi:hypothetical protein
VWFVSLTAVPVAEGNHFDEFAGAQISCWVARPQVEAVARATQLVAEQGWRVTSVEESCEVVESDYAPGDPGGEYFRQAKVDGEVWVFYTWPNDAPDRDTNQ